MPRANPAELTQTAAQTRSAHNVTQHANFKGPVTGRIGPNDFNVSGYVNPTTVAVGASPSSTVSAKDVNKAYPGWEQDNYN